MKMFFGVMFLVGAIACSSRKVPGDILPPDKMKLVMYDLIRGDDLVNSFVLRDTALQRKTEHFKMYQKVFTVHNITRQQFYKSLEYYQQRPLLNKKLFDSLSAYANRQRDRLNADTTRK